MKHVLILLLTFTFAFPAWGECKWASDIKENSDGSYTYTRECHIEAGKKIKGYSLLETEVSELRKTIELKDLALTKQTAQTQMWMDTSLKTGDKLASYEHARTADNNLHFAAGLGVAILSVWAAGQLK